MSKAEIAGKEPIGIEVEKGKDYWWCQCGKSKSQPFCDGSHKGTEFQPQQYTANKTATIWFCACKQTANAPLCDGSHTKL